MRFRVISSIKIKAGGVINETGDSGHEQGNSDTET